MINKKHALKNFIYAFGAQGISFFLNVLIALFIPKILDIKEFGYWQLYLFYFSYIGLFLFGLNDGIYLKYGGIDYSDLPKDILGIQFRISIVFELCIAIFISLGSLFCVIDPNRIYVLIMISITMVLNNLAAYLGYIFQAANETSWYSKSIIIDKLILLILIIVSIIKKINSFKYYILLYLCGRSFALIYCMIKGRDIVFSKAVSLKLGLKEVFKNISIGINLMLANIASTLVIGFARFVVDGKWGIEVFGKFSLALSIENFILLFIGQVSMVIFPLLKKVSIKKQQEIYKAMRDALFVILPLAFVGYAPFSFLMGLWLPQYKDSLIYLGILLPICTFDGKMNLLCTTYFKVLRKEKILLAINIATTFLSLIFALLGAYYFVNIKITAILLVCAIAIRSYISEFYLAYLMGHKIIREVFAEFIMVTVFIYTASKYNLMLNFVVMLVMYFVLLAFSLNKIKVLKNYIVRS